MRPGRRGFGGWLRGPGKYLIGLAIVVAGAGAWYTAGDTSSAQPTFRLAKVERGTLANTVTASGTLRAIVTVDVGTQISGQVRQLFADFNTEVKAGQVIARIDPSTYEAKVKEAEADLVIAKSNLSMMQARLESMVTDSRQAKSAMTQAKLDLERKKELLPSKAIAQSAYDLAVATFEQAEAKHQGLLAKEAEQKAQIEVARAQILQKEATLSQRRIDLDYTLIKSPVNGVVIARNVDVGQTVAASLQSPILFTIAQDLKQMQVEVNVDEADIGRIRDGQTATFTVDSFPGRTFPGQVRQVRKAPKEVSSVITYTVVVSTQNPDLRLLPGMTANVTFQIQRRENVAMIPNTALRFRPAAATPAAAGTPEARPERRNPDGPRGNPQARMDEQLATLTRDLDLTEQQQQQVRAIYAEMGQKMRGLRSAGTSMEDMREEIGKLRRAAEDRIAALLTAEQRTKYDELRGTASDDAPRRATLYVPGPDGKPKAVRVMIGISDGTNTELTSGELKPGDPIIVGIETRSRTGATPAGPGRRFGL